MDRKKRIKRLFSLPTIPIWLLYLWRLLEVLDTMNGIVGWLSSVRDFFLSPGGTIIIIVVGFVLLGYIVLRPEKKKKDENELESISNDLDVKNKELKKKNIQTDIQVTTNEILITAEEKDLLDNYKSLINNERAHLNEIVIVLKGKLYHHTFNPRDGGEVHFEFNIFNGSVFQVEVGKKVSGELKLQGYNKFLHDIEPLESVIIDRNKYGKVLIKQRILPEVCDDINKKALDGFDLIFYFEKVKVDITEFNSNIPYVPKYLVLPKKLSYHIKLQLLEGKFAKYDITRLHDTNDS